MTSDATEACPVALEASLGALRMEGGALGAVLAHLSPEALDRPSVLPAWTVQQLLAHLVRGVDRITAYLAAPIPPQARTSWTTYWTAGAANVDPGSVAERARQFAAKVNGRTVVEVWETSVTRAVEEAASCPPGRLLQPPFGPMRLDHYLTTRVVELTVHGLDLRRSLDLEAVCTPPAREVTCHVLERLLGGERPDELEDDVAFVLAATGRREHPDPRLPVLT
ncbi:MAG: maleylpyruvate isomerase N-terminal domain-containing protein [Actinomycetes bacterium]